MPVFVLASLLQNIFGFFVVVGATFALLAVISSFFRFQRMARGVHPGEAEEVDPSNTLLLGILHRLGSMHREPAPFIVLLMRVAQTDEWVAERGGDFAPLLHDAVLRRVRSRLRATDFVVPLDGGRVAAILDTPLYNAPAIVQRLQLAIASEPLRGEGGWSVRATLCVGVADYPGSGARTQQIYDQAGEYLAEALAGAGFRSGEIPPVPQDDGELDPRQKAVIDELTGLMRPDRLDSAVQKYVARFRKDDKPVSMLYLDVDHLQSYNDHYGPPGGDAILRALGKLLEIHVRMDDLVGRYDGEEFLIVMPGGPEQAAQLGRRLIQLVRQTPIRMGTAQLKVTVSIGIASFPDHGTLPRELFEAASAALYQAKSRGRGICAVYDASLPRMNPQARTADTL